MDGNEGWRLCYLMVERTAVQAAQLISVFPLPLPMVPHQPRALHHLGRQWDCASVWGRGQLDVIGLVQGRPDRPPERSLVCVPLPSKTKDPGAATLVPPRCSIRVRTVSVSGHSMDAALGILSIQSQGALCVSVGRRPKDGEFQASLEQDIGCRLAKPPTSRRQAVERTRRA